MQVVDVDDAVAEAEALLFRAGFNLHSVSFMGNSRYYKFLKRTGTLRISDHPRSEYSPRQVGDDKVLASVTINSHTKHEHITGLVAEAIGRYLIKSGDAR